MRLIVDTSILISSLLKDSITREILLLPFMSFYLPEFALEEIETKKEKISKLSGLSRDEIDILLDLMLDNISIVSAKMIEPHLEEADKLIGRNDFVKMRINNGLNQGRFIFMDGNTQDGIDTLIP